MPGRLLLIGGGGTGGHVSPGLGVAAEWERRQGPGSAAWVGRPGSLEERMVGRTGLPFHAVESAALRRGLRPENLALPWVLLKGLRRASRLLRERRPAAVLLTGGYVGLPLGLAALARSVPLVLLEPNAVPGLANRLLGLGAARLCLGWPAERPGRNAVRTGTPCRLGALPERERARLELGLEPGRAVLLVLPGSQGARSINAALAGALPALKDRSAAWAWLWMSGEADLEAARRAAAGAPFPVRVEPFIHDVARAYAACDLVLCRSGASTLAELGAAAKPGLLVPYPHATGDHQRANARLFVQAGAAEVLDEAQLDAGSLERALRRLLDGDLGSLARAAGSLGRPDAAARVVDEIEAVAR